jgi:hypothetical protein
VIIMNEERFNQRLKEANKGYEDSLKMIKAQKEIDKSERIMDSTWLAHHMNLAHMRSTLRYINGEVDNLFEEIRKNAFTTQYLFGLMDEDSMKYALSNGYLELEQETIERLVEAKKV